MRLNKMLRNKALLIKSLVILMIVSICGVSATAVYSANNFDMEITYNGESYKASLNEEGLKNKMFFNNSEAVELEFEADLSSYYKENIKDLDGGELGLDIPFEVIANLNSISNIDVINTEVIEIVEEDKFTGKYNVKLYVPAGLDNESLNVSLDIKEDNTWGINPEFFMNFNIVRDTVAPEVSVNGISDNKIATGDVTINVVDEYMDEVKTELVLLKDGAQHINKTFNGDTSITLNKEIKEDGEYIGTVLSVDKAGNSKSVELEFNVNKNAPTITINGKAIVSDYREKSLSIEVYDNSKLNFDESYFTIRNVDEAGTNELVEERFKELSNKNGVGNLVVNRDGTYELKVCAVDKFGEKKEITQTITIDTVDPIVSIDIVDGEVFTENQKAIVTIEEKNIKEKAVKVNGILVNKFNEDGDKYVYELDLTANNNEDRNYTIEVLVRDKAGREAGNVTNICIDKKNPEITFTGVESGNHYNEDKTVNIKVYDENLELNKVNVAATIQKDGESEAKPYEIELSNNGLEEKILNKTFSEEGKYSIEISAEDKVGHAYSNNIEFTIDKTAPVINVQGAESNSFNKDKKIINVSVIENWFKENNVSINVNEEIHIDSEEENNLYPNWDANKIETKVTYEFNKDGKYTLVSNATDKAGNKAIVKEVTNFVIDKNAPKIEINGVEDGVFYDSNKNISINVEDNNHEINKVTITRNLNGNEEVILNNEDLIIDENSNVAKLPVKSLDNEGDYNVVVSSTDKAGHASSQEISFTIDKTAPVVSIVDAENNGQELNGSYFNVDKKVEIVLSDVNHDTYEIKAIKDNVELPIIIERNVNSIVARGNFTEEGIYEIRVKATDKSGNSLTNEKGDKEVVVSFTIDKTMPVISIEDVNPYYNENVIVKGRIVDVNFDKQAVWIDLIQTKPNNETHKVTVGEDKVKITPVEGKENTYEFEAKDIKFEGVEYFNQDAKYEVYVKAKDKAGNDTDTLTEDEKAKNKVEFILDKTKPSIAISGVESETYNKGKIDLAVTIDDNNHKKNTFIVSKADSAYGEFKEIVREVSETNNNRVIEFTKELKEDGRYKLVVESEDWATNTSRKEYDFIIDNRNPVIKTNFNSINGSYNNPHKAVNIEVIEANHSNIYENQVLVAIVKGEKIVPDMEAEKFDLSFALTGETTSITYLDQFSDDAIYNLEITIEDSAKNIADKQSVQFTTDKTFPVINHEGVENDEYYNHDRKFTVNTLDVNNNENIITVTKDGSSYLSESFAANNREASYTHTFTNEGIYVINVVSKDKAGNTTTYPSIKFEIDKTKPEITPIFKGEGRVIKNGEYINKVFTPEFKLDKPNDDKIDVVTLNGEGNYAGGVPMASKEMVYNYSVTASDKAKNVTNLNISFTVDTSMPEIKISGILSGFFSKDMKPEYEIKDTNLDGGKSGVTLNGTPFASGTVISEQDHYNLKFVGTDLASNVTTKTIGFAVDKDKPVIKFLEPISGRYFTEDFIPNFIIEDLTDYTIIAMTLDGEDYEIGDEVTEEGKHVLYIEVKDKADNVESLSVEFILDKTAPKFILDGVKNKGKYYEAINTSIKLDNPLDKIKSIEVNGELAQGDVKEEAGQEVVKLNFTEINKYELKLTATDEAGNVTEDIINFEIAEKNIFVKFYQNKVIFYPTLILAIGAIISLLIAKVKLPKKDEKEGEE